MVARIETARLALDATGTPYSLRYDDVYHSRAGGLDQARDVFLSGNRLPERWANRAHFTVLETGFGLGTNFLATWSAWREDRRHPQRLHFVSIERSPFAAQDLAAWHAREPALAELVNELIRMWPPATPGLHRVALDHGRVILTLAFGDAAEVLRNLRMRVDAFYLDGFAPARNPDAWSEDVFKGAARLAAHGATCATYTVARPVAEGLAAAGFAVRKAPGFGPKRDMLLGEFAPRYRVRRHEPPAAASWADRSAIVIGAGIAGLSVAERLAARGWRVHVSESRAGIAEAGSAVPVAALHPVVARDDSMLARLTRAGFLHMLRTLAVTDPAAAREHFSPAALPATPVPRCFAPCGYLLCARGDAAEARATLVARELGFPSSFVQPVDAPQASDIAGIRVARGGYWFPGAGWVRPGAYCGSLLARTTGRVSLGFNQAAARLERAGERWVAFDECNRVIAVGSVVVAASGADLSYLGEHAARAPRGSAAIARCPPLFQVRGQMTRLPGNACRAPRVIVGGDGYCLPLVEGTMWFGATYDRDDPDKSARAQDDARNLQRLARLIPDSDALALRPLCQGHVGFRAVAADRLPLVGGAPDLAAGRGDNRALCGVRPVELPRMPGLFIATGMASRGLAWAAIAAETIASLVEGEPPPLEADLLDAVDPGRFLIKTLRASP